MDKLYLHPDFADFLECLQKFQVDFLIVGAFALAKLGYPRGTGDIDIWIKPEKENAQNALKGISEFGMASLNLSIEDILSGDVIQMGFPPIRIDLMSKLTGVSTEEIWASRQEGKLEKFNVFFLSKEVFIKNKKAIGRHKDLADIESLMDE